MKHEPVTKQRGFDYRGAVIVGGPWLAIWSVPAWLFFGFWGLFLLVVLVGVACYALFQA